MNVKKLNKIMKNHYSNSKYIIIEYYEKIYIHEKKSNYSISNLGNVYNNKYKRNVIPSKSSSGHLHVDLYVNGKSYRFLIHRLVAEYFCNDRGKKYKEEVHHIDRNRSNNAFWNLIWVSKKEHKEIHKEIGFYNPLKGDSHPFTKISNRCIEDIFIDMEKGLSNKDISKKYNLSQSYISSLRSGEKRKDVFEKYDIKPLKILDNRIYGMYDISVLEKVALLILDGKSNTEIQNITGIKRDTVSLIRHGKQHKDIYDKYNLKNVKKLSTRNSEESLDEMTKLILENKLSLKEISEKTGIPYASVNDARLKIRKGKYKRALKFKNTFND